MAQTRRERYLSFVKKINDANIRHMDYKIKGEESNRKDLPKDWWEIAKIMFSRDYDSKYVYPCTRTSHIGSGIIQKTGKSRSIIDTYAVIKNHYQDDAPTLKEFLQCCIDKKVTLNYCGSVKRHVYWGWRNTLTPSTTKYIKSLIKEYDKEISEQQNALIKTEE